MLVPVPTTNLVNLASFSKPEAASLKVPTIVIAVVLAVAPLAVTIKPLPKIDPLFNLGVVTAVPPPALELEMFTLIVFPTIMLSFMPELAEPLELNCITFELPPIKLVDIVSEFALDPVLLWLTSRLPNIATEARAKLAVLTVSVVLPLIVQLVKETGVVVSDSLLSTTVIVELTVEL